MGFLENILENRKAEEVDLYKRKLAAEKQAVMEDPFQQMMFEDWRMENPERDLSGHPAFEAMDKRFQEKLIQKGGPLFQAKKDKEGKTTGYAEKKGAKEKLEQRKTFDPTIMTESGFARPRQGAKEITYQRIIAKPREQWTAQEKGWMNKALNIKGGEPKSGSDWKIVSEGAGDMAQSKRIERISAELQAEGAGPDEIAERIATERKIPATWSEKQPYLRESLGFHFPDMSEEKIDKAMSKYDITLPDYIKNTEEAIKFYEKQGLSREDSIERIQEEFEITPSKTKE